MSGDTGGTNLGIFDGLGDFIVQNQIGNGVGAVVAEPLAVNGNAGAGQVYDTVNNIPRPSRSVVVALVTNNLLVPTVVNPIPPGFYFLVVDLAFLGSEKVLPPGGTVSVSITQRDFLVGSFVVPAALANDYKGRTMIISEIFAGETFTINATAGVNLGTGGSLTVFAIAFCGDFPVVAFSRP
jgi:hypothetical protein